MVVVAEDQRTATMTASATHLVWGTRGQRDELDNIRKEELFWAQLVGHGEAVYLSGDSTASGGHGPILRLLQP